jgi:hypothetical protein
MNLFLSQLYGRFKGFRTGRYHQRQGSRLPFRLELESLESRELLTGTWTGLANLDPLGGSGTMMLLSDGTVMVQGPDNTVVKTWERLSPDSSGSYINGTWTPLASMNLERLYFGSNVLPDGRVFVVGGEYSGPQGDKNWTNTSEIYNPVTDTWTNIANFPQTQFGDDPTMVLPDGTVLAGYLNGPQTYIYNPANNTWGATGSKLRGDPSDEETWVKTFDNSILSYDIFNLGHAQRYEPSSRQWVDAGNAPNNLSSSGVGNEFGPGFLLPDVNGLARVFFIGATGHTAYYTPTYNIWASGPDVPNGLGADDAPGTELPNGKILFAADRPLFNGPTSVFEFDPTTNTYTNVTPNISGLNTTGPSYFARMLVLPTGQILFTTGGGKLAVYTPDGTAGTLRPVISSVVANQDGSYTLAGSYLNGFSAGASYGDDAEMDTNYPVVQLTDGGNHVYYARTHDWNATGLGYNGATATRFDLPIGLPSGTYSLRVIGSGIASDPIEFPISVFDLGPDGVLTVTDISGTRVIDTGVQSFALVNDRDNVFALKTNGDLNYFNAGSWSAYDHGVQAIAGAGGPAVFDLHSNGNLYAQYSDSSAHFYQLDSGVQAIAGSGGPACFDLNSSGRLFAMYIDSPSHFYQLDTGVQTIAGSGGPACFDLNSSGRLFAMYIDSPSHFYQLDTGVQTIAGSGGPACFDLNSSGRLFAMYIDSPSHFYQLDTGVQTIAGSGGLACFDLGTNGNLYAQYIDSPSHHAYLDTGVLAIAGAGGPAVFDLGTNGNLYAQYIDSPTHYSFLTGGVVSIAGTGGPDAFLVATNGGLYTQYLDSPTHYSFLTTGVVSIAGTGGPDAFLVATNGGLYTQYLDSPTHYSFLTTGVVSIAGTGGPDVFLVATNGGLYTQYLDSPTHYAFLDSGVRAIASAGGPACFELHTNGTLYVQNINPSWYTFLDSGVQAIASAGGPACFELHTNGTLYAQYINPSWYAHLDSGVQAIAGAGGPACFALHTNGTLYTQYINPSWYAYLDSGVSAVAGSGGPACFALHTNGTLYAQYIDPSWYAYLDSGASAIAGSGGPACFELHPNGTLYAQYINPSWYAYLDSGVSAIAGSGGPTVFDLHSDGALYAQYVDSPGHRSMLDSGVQAIASGNDGTLYYLQINGDLNRFRLGQGWLGLLDSNVQSFVLGPGGFTVDVLETDGDLWQYHGADRTFLHADIVDIWLGNGGYTLFARDRDGNIWQFPA